ncbi:hypothetical protein AMECASPLE_015931 [Ameca splendens]|uniref:Uncharacterized protein n=1 Tax=Ameca splendens TaxID=208324 RepID=A0ABV0XF74_9TELE
MASIGDFDPLNPSIPATKVEITVSCSKLTGKGWTEGEDATKAFWAGESKPRRAESRTNLLNMGRAFNPCATTARSSSLISKEEGPEHG